MFDGAPADSFGGWRAAIPTPDRVMVSITEQATQENGNVLEYL
jgi:hypothetical protein